MNVEKYKEEILKGSHYLKYLSNIYHPQKNPNGVINLASSENLVLQHEVLLKMNEFPFTGSEPCNDTSSAYSKAKKTFHEFLISQFTSSRVSDLTGEGDIFLNAGCYSGIEDLVTFLADEHSIVAAFTPWTKAKIELIPLERRPQNTKVVLNKDVSEYYQLKFPMERMKKFHQDVDVLVIMNPHFQGGYLPTESEITELLQWCLQNEIHVVAVECFGLSCYGRNKNFTSFFDVLSNHESLHGMLPFLHLIYSPSHDFGYSGFRCGFTLTTNPSLKHVLRQQESLSAPVSSYAAEMISFILSDTSFTKMATKLNKERLQSRAQSLQRIFQQYAVPYIACEAGNSILFNPSLRNISASARFITDADIIYQKLTLWEKHKLFALPAQYFESGWLVISFSALDDPTFAKVLMYIERCYCEIAIIEYGQADSFQRELDLWKIRMLLRRYNKQYCMKKYIDENRNNDVCLIDQGCKIEGDELISLYLFDKYETGLSAEALANQTNKYWEVSRICSTAFNLYTYIAMKMEQDGKKPEEKPGKIESKSAIWKNLLSIFKKKKIFEKGGEKSGSTEKKLVKDELLVTFYRHLLLINRDIDQTPSLFMEKETQFTAPAIIICCSFIPCYFPEFKKHIFPSANFNDLALHGLMHNFLKCDDSLPTLMTMLEQSGRAKESQSIFNVLRSEKISMNPNSWKIIISEMSKQGKGLELSQLLQMMEEDGVEKNSDILSILLDAFSNTGFVDEGHKLYNTIEETLGIDPSSHHIKCVLDMYGRMNCLSDAENFLNEIKKPQISHFLVLLSACVFHRDVERAERIFKKIMGMKPYHASACYLLKSLYDRAMMKNESAAISALIKDKRVKRDPGTTTINLDGVLTVFYCEDKSHEKTKEIYEALEGLYDEMSSAGFSPDSSPLVREAEDSNEQRDHICRHSEIIAIVFGLISSPPGTLLRLHKNYRMCEDCHNTVKFISKIHSRFISLHDENRYHYFTTDGKCSCGDYW